jgi:hypothetical protein
LVSGVKGARSTTTVSSEKKRLGVEGGADRWAPPVGMKRKRKRKKSRERGCGLRPAGLPHWLGHFASGWPSWFPDSFFKTIFFFLLFFSVFSFSLYLLHFLLQITSNQKGKFSINQKNNMKQ